MSRLHALVADTSGGVVQLRYYDPGVGSGSFQSVRGGALGYGLSKNVVEAYQWLVNHYADGDEIYIFGFSRGAYTARSIAGLIAKCGLLHHGAALDADKLFHRYQHMAELRPIYTLDYIALQNGKLTPDEVQLREASRRVPITMVGVWDTVGSLGIPFGDIPGLSRSSFQFHHTRLSNLFGHAYQALAIDEHRADFAPTLWTRFRPKAPDAPTGLPTRTPHVEQRWFIGAHADVGGGCDTALPLIAARWLADKAAGAGLGFTSLPALDETELRAKISDSFAAFMWGLYRIFKLNRRFYRMIGADTVEKNLGWVDTADETIDPSVFDRFRADPSYRPPALLNWAKRRGVNPAALHGAIDSKTGKPL